MQRRTSFCHIPFKNPKPIINITLMHVITKLVTFTKSTGAGQFYSNLVDASYRRLRERITQVASLQATTTGKTWTFGPHWQLIRLISVGLILALASMDPEILTSR
jgi:hypothetical protein